MADTLHRRTRGVALLLVLSALGYVSPAFSGILATDSSQLTVGTGDWAEVIRPLNGTAQTGTTAITRTLTAGAAAVYDRSLELANVGTHNLLSSSIVVTITRNSGTSSTVVTGVYVGCRNGVWSTATTPTCSGTQVTIGTASATLVSGSTSVTLTPSVTMAANATLPLRLAMTSSARNGSFSFTASVSINRARVRLAQTLTS